ELQGIALGGTVRRPEHDYFALAVLIFKLLMGGHHPFQSRWLGAGEPPALEHKIARGWFAYVTTPDVPVAPPPRLPPLDSLPSPLTALVHRCFVVGHRRPEARPTPQEWVAVLRQAEAAQRRCLNDHYFSTHLVHCPQCGARRAIFPRWLYVTLARARETLHHLVALVFIRLKRARLPHVSLRPHWPRADRQYLMKSFTRRVRRRDLPRWRSIKRSYLKGKLTPLTLAILLCTLLSLSIVTSRFHLAPSWPLDDPVHGALYAHSNLVTKTNRARVVNVAPSYLNVRAEPTTSAPVIATLQEATEVEIVATETRNGEWHRIRLGEIEGWVSGAYLTPLPD
ncbi:MAG: SH3 domain-containing protein, partial [Chloroflexota bacterium]|nr:SH3 domain-containing protein [Chloroflexota bacterium]